MVATVDTLRRLMYVRSQMRSLLAEEERLESSVALTFGPGTHIVETDDDQIIVVVFEFDGRENVAVQYKEEA